ncbi:MAG TPA: PIN domain-containing protein [Gemmataceae bacterium]|nr:PIN domain-containing protein [Gemmataceae bacterium]
MKILDTDVLSLLFHNHPRVVTRYRQENDEIAVTIISRIQVLQGRFATLLKAADGAELLRAQQWLDIAVSNLIAIPTVLSIDAQGAVEFDQLLHHKKLKRIGRADLLIAAIALAHRATVVTRNLKDFRQVPGLRVENWAD